MVKFIERIKSIIYSGILSCIVILGSTAPSFAESKTLSIPAYNQQPYENICWATSASIIKSYFKKDTKDIKVDIAKYIHGFSFNKGGTIYDIRDGVKKYANVSGSIKLIPLSYQAVQHQINNNDPIGVAYFYKTGGGHAVVIKGYNNITGTVTRNDPWDGKSKTSSYDYLKNNSSWSWQQSLLYK